MRRMCGEGRGREGKGFGVRGGVEGKWGGRKGGKGRGGGGGGEEWWLAGRTDRRERRWLVGGT